MKKLLLCLLVSASLVACSEKKEADNSFDKYKKNLEVAKQFYEAFSSKDSAKEATLLADNFKSISPSIDQDSVAKDKFMIGEKEYMNAYTETKLTKTQFFPGLDSTNYKPDGAVRIYGVWEVKSATTGKRAKFKYYGIMDFNESGKITLLDEYINMEDLKKEY